MKPRRFLRVDNVVSDVRYAWRALWRTPAVTTVAITTLAIGLGGISAIFSVVNGVILRPLPYPEPERLVSISSSIDGTSGSVSPRDFMDWRSEARSLAGLAASAVSDTILTGSGDAERLTQARVTANTFDVLSIRPVLGRAFVGGEDAVESPRVALLGEALWRRRFGADAGIVGRTLTLDGFPTTVVGIAPAAMQWPAPVDVWLTTRFSDRNLAEGARGARSLAVVARLAAGVTLETARAEMNGIALRLEQLAPAYNANVGARVTPLLSQIVGDVRTPILILLGAVGFVLLIVCANLASLALGRIAERDAELALRTAIGASRGRIVRQLLTECFLLALLGSALGLGFALAGLEALLAVAPANLPRIHDVALDVPTVLVTLSAAALTALLFGVGPALYRSNAPVRDRLGGGNHGMVRRRGTERSRRALVVGEVALAVVLLAGAGLLLRTLAQLYTVDPGFNAERVSTFSTGQLPATYATKERQIELTAQLLDGIRRIPGVTAADVSFSLPLTGLGPQASFTVRDSPDPNANNQPLAQARSAGTEYFEAMGIPLIRGRVFDEGDRHEAPQVVVISAELARRYFAGQDPIGKRIDTGWNGPGWPGQRFGGEIVGIVGDVRQDGLDQGTAAHIYMPYAQWPINEYDVVIRSTGASADVLASTRTLLRQLDANIPMNDARSFAEIVDGSLGDRLFYMRLLAIFAGVALLLAVVGVYGLMAYCVQQRRREIGVRLALGATPERVVGMILSDGLRMVAVGVGLGVLIALSLTPLLQALLYGVGTRDAVTFVAVPGVLLAAAFIACLVPARKAAQLDPVETIRSD